MSSSDPSSLSEYRKKRKFDHTPEPEGKETQKSSNKLLFVIQLHHATQPHFDLRLEHRGVLKSWAVPKGPSLNPNDKRLAVFVEDHPIEYGSFEGVIPKGNYGAGTVMLWDRGSYLERTSNSLEESESAFEKGFQSGKITFLLTGEKLRGEFALIRLNKGSDQKSWLLIKKQDEFIQYKDPFGEHRSVKTGRTLSEIAQNAEERGEVWRSSQKISPPEKNPNEKISAPDLPIEKPKGVILERIPRKNKPMIARKSAGKFESMLWIYEPIFGGVRAIAEVERSGKVTLYSKQGLDFRKKFPEIVSALKGLRQEWVLDGEIFQREGEQVYSIFDALHWEGKGLRGAPLKERKEILTQNFSSTEQLQLTPFQRGSFDFSSKTLPEFKKIHAKHIEGLYHPGTSKYWVEFSVEKPPEEKARLSNLDKVYWPEEKFTKGDLISYYESISEFILPHLLDRPESMHRHPEGIGEAGFFQKDLIGYKPKFVHTTRVFSESSDKSIDYLLCQNLQTLLYMANLGCIEVNPWISRVPNLDLPDYSIIDLDPDQQTFEEVIEIAQGVKHVLDQHAIKGFCKTSGASGIHICIPTDQKTDFDTSRLFAQLVCESVHELFPNNTSLDRTPAKRRGKLYLDFMQNRRGQTLASPYSVRPLPGAPVSTPLQWEELRSGLRPEQFHIKNMRERLQRLGDLWKPLLIEKVSLIEKIDSLKIK